MDTAQRRSQRTFRLHRLAIAALRASAALVGIVLYCALALGSVASDGANYDDIGPLELPDPAGWAVTDLAITPVRIGLPADVVGCPGRAQRWQRKGSDDSIVLRVYRCADTGAASRVLAMNLLDRPRSAVAEPDGYRSGPEVASYAARGRWFGEAHVVCVRACDGETSQIVDAATGALPYPETPPAELLAVITRAWTGVFLTPILAAWLVFVALPDVVRWTLRRPYSIRAPAISVDRAARGLRKTLLPRARGAVRVVVFLIFAQLIVTVLFLSPSPLVWVLLGATSALLLGTYLRRGWRRMIDEEQRTFVRNPGRYLAGVVLRAVSRCALLGIAVFFTLMFDVVVAGGAYANRAGELFGQSGVASLAARAAVNAEALVFLVPAAFFVLACLDRVGRALVREYVEVTDVEHDRFVLYLRNFGDDELRTSATSLSRRGLVERLSPWRARSMSEVVVDQATMLGPVLTAAFPGDRGRLGGLGPRKVRLGEDWEKSVIALAKQAICVVLHATPRAVNAGLTKEIEILSNEIEHDRVILVLGFGRKRIVADRWERFCAEAEKQPFFRALGDAGLSGGALAMVSDRQGGWLTWAARRKTEWTYAAAMAEIAERCLPTWTAEIENSRAGRSYNVPSRAGG